ncbi:hypothetical protein AVEN_161601-1 [Araneus ventricosus]|uniref:Uncharacterized protein n=1 Tax=Araneus ventricosus TaxID=182803 RepID=A0A4Y2FNT9_ARAVE|nr:hypothetical protein AVEN_161601-1 [Araneus ventricosus]
MTIAIEQNNKKINGQRGAVGILDNETVLLKWMVSSPDISKIITEFEETPFIGSAFKNSFKNHTNQILSFVNEEGNPFEESRLISIGRRKLVSPQESQAAAFRAYLNGFKQLPAYIEFHLIRSEHSIHNIIRSNNVHIFDAPVKSMSKTKAKIDALRKDSSLFCKMHVISQHREADFEAFFAYENQPFPPSISENGRL